MTVAEAFLGTPYVWAGNTGFGIDCSGLVQAALLACGIACPGDSDQQERPSAGRWPPDEPARRGDLIFWTGHVALVGGPRPLLHANGHAWTSPTSRCRPASPASPPGRPVSSPAAGC